MQCSECLLYWNQGMIYCTCGHVLVESGSSQNLNKWRLDALSIPHYVIKKWRPHGAAARQKLRHRKSTMWPTTRGREFPKRNYEGIHDRFLRDPVYRDLQLKTGWTEEKSIAMEKLAQEDHSYHLSREEYLRYQNIGISH